MDKQEKDRPILVMIQERQYNDLFTKEYLSLEKIRCLK